MTQTFKIGDRVTVVDATLGLTQGETYTVSGFWPGTGTELVTLEGKTDGFYTWRFRRVEEKPEVGDTVEVTTKKGTVIRGVLTAVGGGGGLFLEGGDFYFPQNNTESLTIIEKVKKPKVWAVGDVVTGGDYSSETIKDGTLAGVPNNSVIKYGDTWIDCQTGVRYPLVDLGAARTIVFIP